MKTRLYLGVLSPIFNLFKKTLLGRSLIKSTRDNVDEVRRVLSSLSLMDSFIDTDTRLF